MLKLKLKKIQIKKPDFKKVDFKKMNVRKLNWPTVLGILAYLNVLVIIPQLLSRKDKPFVKFHAKQGVVLCGLFTLFAFSFYVPGLPWLVALLYLVLTILGLVFVILGRERHLPVIGKFADKI